MFYLDKEKTLYSKLKECVNDARFSADFGALGAKKPAPHECMSCVVGLSVFSRFFEQIEDRSLFARCIIGLPISFDEAAPVFDVSTRMEDWDDAATKQKQFRAKKTRTELRNCIISLLNSSIIDVDRLDYIIRDAATIGFKNVQIDYNEKSNFFHLFYRPKGSVGEAKKQQIVYTISRRLITGANERISQK